MSCHVFALQASLCLRRRKFEVAKGDNGQGVEAVVKRRLYLIFSNLTIKYAIQ